MRAGVRGAVGALVWGAVVVAHGAAFGTPAGAGPAARGDGDAGGAQALDLAARAPASDVRIAPSKSGQLGAWLVVGPFRSATFARKTKPIEPAALTGAPPGVDEDALVPRFDAVVPATAPDAAATADKTPPPPRWIVASSGEGAIDLKAALRPTEADVIAYAAGTLHVERAGRYHLLVGADDGVRVSVDGRAVLTRDEARPERDDDDVIPLDLGAGDHPVVLKLHQRDASWALRVRVVDAELAPPRGAYLALPGTTADQARELATKMSWVSVDRGFSATGYKPVLTVRFPEGAPRGVPLRVTAKLTPARAPASAAGPALFDVDAGEVPLDASGVHELKVALPAIDAADLPAVEDADWTYEMNVAGRTVRAPFHPRRTTRAAIARAEAALASIATASASATASATPAAGSAPSPAPAWLGDESAASVRWLARRLATLVSRGDGDKDAQADEARELDAAAAALEKHVDPFAARTGPMRRAYTSPVDGEPSEFGLYVPPSYVAGAKRPYPLVVALHGLDGRPMAMLRWFFGGDDPKKDQEWEDRHVGPLPSLDAFVVTPGGHGNTMYRDLGEDDVLRVIDWALRTYPIDRDRVTITGPSMGGIGTAAIGFRHPSLFAAAAPLCGYHSYFVRRDFVGRPIRPWERTLGEERSNVMWAWNGERLPLWIVHGTQDLPEANSGVLIERYEQLKYAVEHEHPELGHNVWQTSYEGLKGANWLLGHRRTAHPRDVRFRTLRLRDGDAYWVHTDELTSPDGWGDVEARATSRGAISAKTSGVAALHFDRDPAVVDPSGAVAVTIDGAKIAFAPGEALVLHRAKEHAPGADGAWQRGPAVHDGPYKHGEITGPLRDAFHAPLTFVYGASDPAQTRANEEVARAFAAIRYGVLVRYPVLSDEEFFARGERVDGDRALFLVGNARSNRVVRALEEAPAADFPIRVDGDAIVLGGERFRGRQVGAAFVRPNPKRPDRYVVVVEGVDALGTWRALSLPDLLPDFVVYDEDVGPSRGQMLVGAGLVRAAGFFENDWSIPAHHDDPLAAIARPRARSEYEATPYLP